MNGWRYVCEKCGRQGPIRSNPNDADAQAEFHQDGYGYEHRCRVVEVISR